MSLDAVSDITVQGVVKKNKNLFVFVIQVEWKDGVVIEVYRSYREILELQQKLLKKEEFLSHLKNEFSENRTGYLLQDKTLFGKLGIKKRKKVVMKMKEVEEFLKVVVHLPSIISKSEDVVVFFHPVPDDMTSLDEYESYNIKGPKAMGYALNISEPILLNQYVAVCDYTKLHQNDLNLKAGNIVEVINMAEHGWWFVDLDGHLGWVPASCLEPRDGLEDHIMEVFEEGEEELYITMYDFKPEDDNEVALKFGDIVQVKQKNRDGWWIVRCKDKTGWVPCMYLHELSSTRKGSYTRQLERQTAMMTVQNIFAITDRRTTWNPVMPMKHSSTIRKPTIVRRRHRDNKPEDEEKPSYVNLEFKGSVDEDSSDSEEAPSYVNVDFGSNGKKHPRKHSRGKKEQQGPSYMNMDFHKKNGKSPRTRRSRDEDGDLLEIDFGKMSVGQTETDSQTANKPMKESFGEASPSISTIEAIKEEDETIQGTLPDQGNTETIDTEQNNSAVQDVQDPQLLISACSGGDDSMFLSIGDYCKDADTEVDLHEGETVEVLEQTDGGWWLIRTKDLSIGWAPSNFLEKITPDELKRRKDLGLEPPERPPLRPPKTSRVYKKARAITTEKKFWSFVGKNGRNATCPISEDIDANNNHFSKEALDEVNDVCDLETGVCRINPENTRL